MKIINFAALAVLILMGCTAASAQKKTPDYKIMAIHITPFDSNTGKLDEDEITVTSDRSFFNDLAISLLVVVEVGGESGSFVAGRQAEITVMEGKKIKKKKVEQIGIPSDGKFFIPVWLDSPMCSEITVTARMIGQKTVSRTVRKVPFQCGE
jgi:hypothetical protein